jgi:hypothetical protein
LENPEKKLRNKGKLSIKKPSAMPGKKFPKNRPKPIIYQGQNNLKKFPTEALLSFDAPLAWQKHPGIGRS